MAVHHVDRVTEGIEGYVMELEGKELIAVQLSLFAPTPHDNLGAEKQPIAENLWSALCSI